MTERDYCAGIEPEWKTPVAFEFEHRPGVMSNLVDVGWIAAADAPEIEQTNWARCGNCGHAEKGPDWGAVVAAYNAHDCDTPTS